MDISPASRVAQRIPNLLTLFFSISLVSGFSSLANYFEWRTAPSFDIRDWSDVLVLVGFATTLYFVISVWLAFSVLLERIPYSLNFGRFYFDAARFGLMFAILMWSFLAGQPAHFHHYIFGLAAWHVLMASWYALQLRSTQGSVHVERGRDLRIHGLGFLIYAALGVVYYFVVAQAWQESQAQMLYVALVLLTFVIVIARTSTRLLDLRTRVVHESAPPAAV